MTPESLQAFFPVRPPVPITFLQARQLFPSKTNGLLSGLQCSSMAAKPTRQQPALLSMSRYSSCIDLNHPAQPLLAESALDSKRHCSLWIQHVAQAFSIDLKNETPKIDVKIRWVINL